MKNTPVGGFKNGNALTIIKITVVETYVMAKMAIKNILVLNLNNCVICPTINQSGHEPLNLEKRVFWGI